MEKTFMEKTLVETEKKKIPAGIKGWLLLPAFALCAQPVGFVYKSVSILRNIGEVTIIWPALWLDILTMIMVAAVSWGFFRKRSYAAPLFVAYIALTWVFWAIIGGASAQYLDEGLIGLIFHLTVLLPYLVFSKRVAATFVLEPANSLDRFLAVLGRPAAAVVRLLHRQRWFIILYVAAFLVAMIFLNAAVHSLYSSGNLSETWRLVVG
jgi:hypothetical protein